MTRSGLRPGRAARTAALVGIVLVSAGAGAQEVRAPDPAPAAGLVAPAAPVPRTAAGFSATDPSAVSSPAAPSPGGAPTPAPAPADAAATPVRFGKTPASETAAEPDAGATPLAHPAPTLPLALPALERAWSAPAAGAVERAERVRAAADALGIRDVDPVARALLTAPGAGSPLERARAAVTVAPGLPAAQLALARAAWDAGQGPGPVLAAAARAVAALPRHLDGLLWLEATLLTLLFGAALATGLVWIAARGLLAAPHAAHDLGDRLDPSLPGAARAAWLAVLLLAPAALGAGALGLTLGLFALGWWAADTRGRRALAVAAGLVALALGPLAGAAGRALGALDADPVVRAVHASETGFLDPADALRLERAAETGDPLAAHALARRARRAGDLARAEQLLAPLLASGRRDPTLLNDAAHHALLAGDPAAAIALYQDALAQQPSADLWFNLAQAHVRAIDIEAHAEALEAAQAADPARTSALTQQLARSGDLRVDLPFPVWALRTRLVRAADPAAAAALRAPFVPGASARAVWLVPLLFAAAAVLASQLARRGLRSRGCLDCGTRLCPRCGTGTGSGGGLCADCARRRHAARHGGPWERGETSLVQLARVLRRATRWLPGAHPAPARPGLALAALTALAAAAALWRGRFGVVPDPATVGEAGPLALAASAAVLLATALACGLGAGRAGRR